MQLGRRREGPVLSDSPRKLWAAGNRELPLAAAPAGKTVALTLRADATGQHPLSRFWTVKYQY
jgi:hypothetical protein